MKLLRIETLMLVTALGAGPALLDRCLISCHDDSPSDSAVPTCHEHAATSTAPSVHGVQACGHDHDGLPADTIGDSRAAKARHISMSTLAVMVYRPVPPTSVDLPVLRRDRHLTLVGRTVPLPLRL